MSTIIILNLAQITRCANEYEDPRWIFYQPILESRTFAGYMDLVGGEFVVPPTHARRMGAAIEYKHMRDDRHWIREDADSDYQASDSSGSTSARHLRMMHDSGSSARSWPGKAKRDFGSLS